MNSTVKPHSIVLSEISQSREHTLNDAAPVSVWSSDAHGIIVRTAVTKGRKEGELSLQINSTEFWFHKTQNRATHNVTVTVSCHLDTSLEWSEKRTSAENCLHQVVLWPCVWGIFLIASCCRKTQPTLGGVIPRQVDLGMVQSEQAVLLRGFCFTSTSSL